jgi:hypothetical protein
LSDAYSERPPIYLGPYIPSDHRRKPFRGAVPLHQSVVDASNLLHAYEHGLSYDTSVTKIIFMCCANSGRGNGNLFRIVYKSWVLNLIDEVMGKTTLQE